ncbi:MAG: DUF465 domain-containing protein [Thermodesulfobacteriota bacterium]
MDARDLELIERLKSENPRLAELWEQHQRFEAELEELNRRVYLTPEEQVRSRETRKLKLAGRDEMETILARHRAGETAAQI